MSFRQAFDLPDNSVYESDLYLSIVDRLKEIILATAAEVLSPRPCLYFTRYSQGWRLVQIAQTYGVGSPAVLASLHGYRRHGTNRVQPGSIDRIKRALDQDPDYLRMIRWLRAEIDHQQEHI